MGSSEVNAKLSMEIWADRLRAAAPIVIFLAIGAALLAAFLAVNGRQAGETIGTISSVGLVESDNGAHPNAQVRLADGSLVLVSLPRNHECEAGRAIRLRIIKAAVGQLYRAPRTGCRVAKPH